jgi:hypothetical protein
MTPQAGNTGSFQQLNDLPAFVETAQRTCMQLMHPLWHPMSIRIYQLIVTHRNPLCSQTLPRHVIHRPRPRPYGSSPDPTPSSDTGSLPTQTPVRRYLNTSHNKVDPALCMASKYCLPRWNLNERSWDEAATHQACPNAHPEPRTVLALSGIAMNQFFSASTAV